MNITLCQTLAFCLVFSGKPQADTGDSCWSRVYGVMGCSTTIRSFIKARWGLNLSFDTFSWDSRQHATLSHGMGGQITA